MAKPIAVSRTSHKQVNKTVSGQKVSFGRRIKYWIEFAFIRLLAEVFSALSRRQALNLGRKIGWLIYKLLYKRAGIARKNLIASFPGISEAKIQSIIQSSWENLGAGVGEFVKMPSMSLREIDSFITCEGLEHLRESYAKGKGALLLTAHYGAWEIGAKFWPRHGFSTAAIARKVKNPLVNRWVTKIRSSDGVKMIFAENAVRESVRWLKGGNILALLIDHRVTEGDLQVMFFGRPASTTSLPGILALRYLIPIHPMRCWREGDKVRIQVSPAMNFADLAHSEAGIAQATLRMSDVVEGWVRERPQEWLWIHNRWKMAPAAAV